jgi:hypothetical protein
MNFQITFNIDLEGIEASPSDVQDFIEFSLGAKKALNTDNPLFELGLLELRAENVKVKQPDKELSNLVSRIMVKESKGLVDRLFQKGDYLPYSFCKEIAIIEVDEIFRALSWYATTISRDSDLKCLEMNKEKIKKRIEEL